MGLRLRTAVIFIATMLASTVTAILISRSFFMAGYAAIEDLEAGKTYDRARTLVEDDLDQLETLAQDWAYWDDAWTYARGVNPDFPATNLGPETIEGLGLSALAIIDPAGRILFAGPPGDAEAATLAGRLRPRADAAPGLRLRGLAATERGIHLLAARTILRSDQGGAPAGILLMARPVDKGLLGRHARLLGVETVIRANEADPSGPPERALTETSYSLSASLPGIDGEPVARMTVTMPRTVHRYGSASVVRNIVAVGAVLGLISLAAFWILEALVFRSIRSVGVQLSRIASGRDPGARILIPGGDEIGRLAGAMNGALDELQARIRERETMLREIHHRVKNNLQVIASLLNLQAGSTGDPKAAGAIAEARRRVLAMASVHDELYDDPDLSGIGLRFLVEKFVRSFESERAGISTVEVLVEVDEIPVDMEEAVPLGLFLSEALSNCHRHAFPAGRRGRIELRSATGENGLIELSVRDDGVGMGEAEPRKGLGLALIEAIASQIGGRASWGAAPEGGTLVRVLFPARGTAGT